MFTATITSAQKFKENVQFLSRVAPGKSWRGPDGQRRIVMKAMPGVLHLSASDNEYRQATRGVAITKQDGELFVAVKPDDVLAPLRGWQENGKSLSVSYEAGSQPSELLLGGKVIHCEEPQVVFLPDHLTSPDAVVEAFTCSAVALRDAFRAIEPSLSRDERRPILTGALLRTGPDGVTLASTYAHRLTRYDLKQVFGEEAQQPREVIIPGGLIRLFLECEKDLKGQYGNFVASVKFGPSTVTITTGSLILTGRLIEGEFPNFERCIPQTCDHFPKIPAGVIVELVRALAPTAKQDSQRIVFDFDGETFKGHAAALVGDTQVEAVATRKAGSGDAWHQAFNATYMTQMAEVFGSSEILLGSNTELEPLLATAEEFPGAVVIMPMCEVGRV